MAQQIFYIIIPNESVEVPLEIVHFEEKNGLIIPLLIGDEDYYTRLISISQNHNDLNDFLENLHPTIYEHPTRKALGFLNSKVTKSFGIIGYKETLEIPDNLGDPVLFVDGEKVSIPESNNSEGKEQYVHNMLNIEYSFGELIRNEKKYKSFRTCERFYFQELKKRATNIK